MRVRKIRIIGMAPSGLFCSVPSFADCRRGCIGLARVRSSLPIRESFLAQTEEELIRLYSEHKKRGRYLAIWLAFKNSGQVVGGSVLSSSFLSLPPLTLSYTALSTLESTITALRLEKSPTSLSSSSSHSSASACPSPSSSPTPRRFRGKMARRSR